jgi:hypothetical protein
MAFILFLSATGASYGFHTAFETLASRRAEPVRLIIGNYHLHHSVLGIFSIIVGIAAWPAVLAPVALGYGVGNIWQHKLVHNKVNEKGLVFVDRFPKN